MKLKWKYNGAKTKKVRRTIRRTLEPTKKEFKNFQSGFNRLIALPSGRRYLRRRKRKRR